MVQPWVQSALVPAVGGSRLYAIPQVAAAGPAWWVEAVEYPTGHYPRVIVPFAKLRQPQLPAPAAPIVATMASGVLTGVYTWRVTFLGIAGETAASAASAPATLTAQQAVLTLPLGPAPWCLGRNLYRTPANGADGSQLLVATIADNTTTTVSDNALDSALGVPLPAGDSTANAHVVELGIADSQLPDPAAPGTVGITYGSKHVFAANGTTVPEQHHDVVLLGAAAHACLAFQVTTNDLFEYQDGEMRDRVNEQKTADHWLAAGKALMARFDARLEEVKRQRDAGHAAVAQWGSVPVRWNWT